MKFPLTSLWFEKGDHHDDVESGNNEYGNDDGGNWTKSVVFQQKCRHPRISKILNATRPFIVRCPQQHFLYENGATLTIVGSFPSYKLKYIRPRRGIVISGIGNLLITYHIALFTCNCIRGGFHRSVGWLVGKKIVRQAKRRTCWPT